ncbi:alpha-L-rhamnosidase [Clostridium saccharoperbutylacetonicum]
MKITKMKTNHIKNPLGFCLGKPKLTFVVTDTTAIKQEAAQIEVALDENFDQIIFDSGKDENIDSLGVELEIELKPCTRYFWKVKVWADNGESASSDIQWFETGKMGEAWSGSWITPELDKDVHTVMLKAFKVEKEIKAARAYVCGLGLYEIMINGAKAGNEYLTPNCNAYDKWLQYQTYDITDSIKNGQNNIEVILGNGWYKGRFGFDGGAKEIFGDKFALLCDIVINFTDGTSSVIKTDNSWKCRESQIKFSGIYDGEFQDALFKTEKTHEVKEINLGFDKLKERLSLPVVIKEEIKPIEIIKTPLGETILDMGQNMVGWIKFITKVPKGTEILLQYGELLQDGNFYRDNLRTAKAEFKYIADGEVREVRPYFTYYGFRYVKISGLSGDINIDDFTGCVLYSDMETTGHIETSNLLVNKLFNNALWSQKGNFLDVPTDCPQRDEKMGWTGDAQVFSGTAAFNMDTYAFFTKYAYDLNAEQKAYDGMVPMVVPSINMTNGGSSAWGDAATIIPWNMYLYYGDKTILENQFDSMRSWVDYIRRADDENGSQRLWTTGFHFGDWLGLDMETPGSPKGGTEESFIASAYYYYSSMLVTKAAKVLGKEEEAKKYEALANEVLEAIRDEYFTKKGRLALKNQTAYVVALFMDLVPEEHKKRVANDLALRLSRDKGYLKTGFVGSPYICRALSENGYNEIAYKLLLNKECPSWLYPVTMGATTIWERWDSVLPDGKISGTGMNSLNHYAYGSIAEWMYRNMCGINPVEKKPGFRHIKLSPMPDYRFKYAKAVFDSPVGLYESGWNLNEDGTLEFKLTIPFNATATLVLPNANIEDIYVNGNLLKDTKLKAEKSNKDVCVELLSGKYEFKYMPTQAYIKYYSTNMSLLELLANNEVKEIFEKNFKAITMLPPGIIDECGGLSIREINGAPFFNVSEEELTSIDKMLGKIKVTI